MDYSQYSTTYFYKIGDADVSREFSFTTPPESGPDVPYTFGLIGDQVLFPVFLAIGFYLTCKSKYNANKVLGNCI